MSHRIPFNRPHVTGREFHFIAQAIATGHLSGNGQFTALCHDWLVKETGAQSALLTHSCTAALEMSALLVGLEAGDEVIMPSFTFVSTANAFVLRGAKPVFVDVRPDTLNLDERLVEAAITPRTKMICAVHYAGVACEMNVLMPIADRHRIAVVEDDAQGAMSSYRGKPLGSMGHLAALSFHETKNVISGEGGALLVNRAEFVERAEILWEKGTNRRRFLRGQVDKYTWVDVGSSFLPSELIAAFLWAQMQEANTVTLRRLALWQKYFDAFEALEARGVVRRPVVPEWCRHNGHMFYLLMPSLEARTRVIAALQEKGIQAVFHYIPLHSSPAGLKFGEARSAMTVTDDVSERLLRFPLWPDMPESVVDEVCEVVGKTL